MEIVRAKAEHLDGIMEIERQSFPDPWSRGGVEVYLTDPSGEILAVLEGQEVVGFAIYHVSYDESELFTIAVRADSRGRGVGRALLDAVLSGRGPGARGRCTWRCAGPIPPPGRCIKARALPCAASAATTTRRPERTPS